MSGNRLFRFSFAFCIAVVLVACGSSSPQKVPLGTSQVSLTIHDTPPTGVTVLSFQISVIGATLTPAEGINQDSSPVSLLSSPVDVELTQLVTDSAVLNPRQDAIVAIGQGVPEGTYQNITVTFANPAMTILNNSGSAIGACASGATCQLTPTLSPAATTYPIALGLTANTSVGLQIDFNLSQSIQSDLSVIPVATVSKLSLQTSTPGPDILDQIDNIVGQVTNVQPASQRFGLVTNTGQTLTIYNADSQYQGFSDLGILEGQTVRLEAALHPDGTLWATQSYLLQDAATAKAQGLLVGIVSSVDSATQFHMVVQNVLGASSGVQIGDVVTTTIQGGATFAVESQGFAIPAGFSFASPLDLLPGQEVQIAVPSASTGTEVSTDQVTLLPSQLTANVSATRPGAFDLNNLPTLFTSSGNTSIGVKTDPATQLENIPWLSVNDTVAVCAFLFNTTASYGTPSMLATKVVRIQPTT